MSTDGGAPGRESGSRSRRFVVEVDDDGPFEVGEVRGFRAALLAAEDAAAPMPRRLVFARPDDELRQYLACWSEDSERVRRGFTIGGREGRLLAVVTLSSFGPGVEPSLAIESLTPACDAPGALFRRSGVHPKVDVDAALGAS